MNLAKKRTGRLFPNMQWWLMDRENAGHGECRTENAGQTYSPQSSLGKQVSPIPPFYPTGHNPEESLRRVGGFKQFRFVRW
jgi:hypothetical protein